jgi:hypothetical protein
MSGIEGSGFPLVFKADAPDIDAVESELGVEVLARCLEGMQKEALVRVGESPPWRMVSDEGPYLEGTDLAPFPLAFFTAGMQFSFLSALARLSREEGIALHSARLAQDNFYSMEGSFLRGDAEGGARPAELHLSLDAEASPDVVARLVRRAHRSHPAHAVMRDILENRFALVHNGRALPLDGLRPSSLPAVMNPRGILERLRPADPARLPAAVEKVAAAAIVHGVEGGAGTSLSQEQKRTLHVHGEAHLLTGLRAETTIQLFKPIGSTFRFQSDESQEAAPSSLAYLCAGVAFCYLTQIGRYARIVRRSLDSYSVCQRSAFRREGSPEDDTLVGRSSPFDTAVFLEGSLSESEARDLVWMGERTCFLHASMRGSFPSRLVAELGGDSLEVD